MDNFLTLSTTYETVDVGIFSDTIKVTERSLEKRVATKELIPIIHDVLDVNHLTLNDIAFIVVNQGPAPFTSLRSTLVSANGIAFATGIPLVGVDGLACYARIVLEEYPNALIILDAYAQDVYFAHMDKENSLKNGYAPMTTIIEERLAASQSPLTIIGNGTVSYASHITQICKDRCIIPTSQPPYIALDQIAQQGLLQWKAQENISQQLLPLYLKKINYPKAY